MEKRRSTKNRKQAKPPIAKEKSASARNSAAGSFLSSSPLKSKYQRLKDILIRPVLDNTLSPIVNRATEVIGDRDEAMRWLGTPVRGLDYATPISLLGTEEGATRVNDILGQMEHGIWQRVTVYRICSSKYPNNDGEGSRLYGGRWNHKGMPLLYCGANISLCVLEILVHSGSTPRNKVLIEAELPDDLHILTLDDTSLPPDWDAPVDQDSTKDLGARWAEGKDTAVMSVPSAVIRQERNYLINPLHPDFSRISFSTPEMFVFDPRLK